jgi:hypothetical protein
MEKNEELTLVTFPQYTTDRKVEGPIFLVGNRTPIVQFEASCFHKIAVRTYL